jgi:hypothetical protein
MTDDIRERQMQTTVDVWIAGRAAANLTPPPLPLADSTNQGITVRTCVARGLLQERIEIDLTVDEVAARKLSRACRDLALWERRVVPSVLILAPLVLGAGILATARHDEGLGITALLLAVALLVSTVLGRIFLRQRRCRQHPTLTRRRMFPGSRSTVRIRDVDQVAAESWASVNSPDVMRVVR